MPVGATTTTRRRVVAMKWRMRVDLPVPALPVRKRLRPSPRIVRARSNSSVRMIDSPDIMAPGVVGVRAPPVPRAPYRHDHPHRCDPGDHLGAATSLPDDLAPAQAAGNAAAN